MQEHFRNRINEYALQWVKTLLAAVRNGSHIFESQYNSQRRAQADYKDRFFYELLQNARDVQGCSKIKIVLQNNQLGGCYQKPGVRYIKNVVCQSKLRFISAVSYNTNSGK